VSLPGPRPTAFLLVRDDPQRRSAAGVDGRSASSEHRRSYNRTPVGDGEVTVVQDLRFTRPLYTVAEASRLVGMSPSTFSTWAHGYRRKFADRPDVLKGPVITATTADRPGDPTIPFAGLVEATVVQAFRRTELPLQRIRRALEVLAQQGELDHPLASRRLYSDGAQMLFDYATESSDGQLRLLTVVDSGQRVFHEVISEYLRRIEFGDEWASALVVPVTPHDVLRIRPDVADGDPLFVHGGAPLSAVRSRLHAGEPISSVGDDYGIPIEDLGEAIRGLNLATAA
jgi:uncharacterized protein (DUF433 family)